MMIIRGSVIFSALLIMVSKAPVAYAMSKQEGGYDNHYPRDQQAKLTGLGKRALGGHTNSIEAFPLFASGVAFALIGNAEITTIQNLCIVFICSRVAYLICYWIDQDFLRSTFWSVGFISSIWLMALALP